MLTPLGFSELEYILSENDMILEKIATNKYMRGEISSRFGFVFLIMAMVIYPFIKVTTRKHFGKRLQSSKELLWGEILVLKARKL